MKRLTRPLFLILVLVACSRQDPTPTSPPSPTLPPVAQASCTPQGSRAPRITIVPSATRLQPTLSQEPEEIDVPPTSTAQLSPLPIPSSTPTPRIIDTSATATLRPTATTSGDLSPTPTLPESPLTLPSGTPSPTATPALSPEATGDGTTPTPTPESEASPTPTVTLESSEESWSFENIFGYYDDVYQELYLSGKVVNDTDQHQRITTLTPVVYDQGGSPVTLEDVIPLEGYDELIEAARLAPGQSLSFGFLILLPFDVSIQENYEVVVEAEPAEAARDDLVITYDDFESDWPYYFYVNGTWENPGPELTEYVLVVVTVYDEEQHVIGMGSSYETGASQLAVGEHDFEVDVELWEIVDFLELEVYNYQVQLFGY